jgi:hypothetical protein
MRAETLRQHARKRLGRIGPPTLIEIAANHQLLSRSLATTFEALCERSIYRDVLKLSMQASAKSKAGAAKDGLQRLRIHPSTSSAAPTAFQGASRRFIPHLGRGIRSYAENLR